MDALNKDKQILLAFYGDDFTGSTDALEFLCRAGAKTVLFIEPPTADQLRSYPGLDAFGVAGMTRSLTPGEMEKVLVPAFEQIRSIGPKQVHYKVCSTFDSSPATGSIGKAIDCGAEVFGTHTIAVLGGMPALGRYCVFGNVFARMGIGSKGSIFRLDRHPSMSKHPVTPADESDLRVHLEKQTDKQFGLIDIIELEKEVGLWNADKDPVVLIDALYEEQLVKTGEWLDKQYNGNDPVFSVGTSGIEMGLGNWWNRQQILTPVDAWTNPGRSAPLLVISGSCSPVTTAQIRYAKANGFEEVILDAQNVCRENRVEEAVFSKVKEWIGQQKSVIVHTGQKQSQNLSSEKLGSALGCIARIAVETEGVKRVVISGGDTSSYAARAMQIEAVEMIAPIITGAPLCRVISSNKKMHGLEVNFKGGQVGSDNYFELLMMGTTNHKLFTLKQ